MTPSEEFVLVHLTESEGWPEEWVTYRGNEPGLGYDIEIKDPSERVFRAIEVKTPLGHGSSTLFQPSQLAKAEELGDSYWVYFVEYRAPQWHIKRIVRNPIVNLGPSRREYSSGIAVDIPTVVTVILAGLRGDRSPPL